MKGPAELLEAVNKFSTYTLQVAGSYKMKGGMEHVSAQVAVAVDKELAPHHGPFARSRCSLSGEEVTTARYSVRVRFGLRLALLAQRRVRWHDARVASDARKESASSRPTP